MSILISRMDGIGMELKSNCIISTEHMQIPKCLDIIKKEGGTTVLIGASLLQYSVYSECLQCLLLEEHGDQGWEEDKHWNSVESNGTTCCKTQSIATGLTESAHIKLTPVNAFAIVAAIINHLIEATTGSPADNSGLKQKRWVTTVKMIACGTPKCGHFEIRTSLYI